MARKNVLPLAKGALFALVLLQCVVPKDVLERVPADEGVGGSSGGTVGGGSAGTISGGGGLTGGGLDGAVSGADKGGNGGEPTEKPCETDEDCAESTWCISGVCSACPTTLSCPEPPMLEIIRHGCAWCVPLWDCNSELECDEGEVCYAGRTCESGCNGDSTCCFGNICGPPGCPATNALDCARVGCPNGYYCDVVDPDQVCACNEGNWLCTTGSRNSCKPIPQ